MIATRLSTYARWGALALLGLVLWLVEARFQFVRSWVGNAPLSQREVATEQLGRYLARNFAGQQAIVLSNPFSQKPGQPGAVYEFEKAGLRGLRRGLGRDVTIAAVVFPELKSGPDGSPQTAFIDPQTTTPLSYLISENALDTIAAQHPQATVFISLIGLPLDVRESQFWNKSPSKKLALLLPDLRMLGSTDTIRQAVKDGHLAAMVCRRPGAVAEPQVHRDRGATFDHQFVLVTPDNFDEVLTTYPKLFR